MFFKAVLTDSPNQDVCCCDTTCPHSRKTQPVKEKEGTERHHHFWADVLFISSAHNIK